MRSEAGRWERRLPVSIGALTVTACLGASLAGTVLPSAAQGDAFGQLYADQDKAAPAAVEPDAFEPDDTQEQAATLTPGEPQERTLHNLEDEDWATFTLAEAATVTVRTSGASGSTDTAMGLFGRGRTEEFELLRKNDDTPEANSLYSSIRGYNLAPGTYRVHIVPVDFGGRGPGPYTLSLELGPTVEVPADGGEPDNSRSRARRVTPGARAVRRTFHTLGDVDYFSFHLKHTSEVTILTGPTSATSTNKFGDTYLFLYRGSREVAADDDSGEQKYAAIRKKLAAGTYTVSVLDFGPLVDPGYSFRVTARRVRR